jgi:hypothetical protein
MHSGIPFCCFRVLNCFFVIISYLFSMRADCALLTAVLVFIYFSIAFYGIVVASNTSPTGFASRLILFDQFLADPI